MQYITCKNRRYKNSYHEHNEQIPFTLNSWIHLIRLIYQNKAYVLQTFRDTGCIYTIINQDILLKYFKIIHNALIFMRHKRWMRYWPSKSPFRLKLHTSLCQVIETRVIFSFVVKMIGLNSWCVISNFLSQNYIFM